MWLSISVHPFPPLPNTIYWSITEPTLFLGRTACSLVGAEIDVQYGLYLLPLLNTICGSILWIKLISGRTACSLVVRRSLCCCTCQPFSPYMLHYVLVSFSTNLVLRKYYLLFLEVCVAVHQCSFISSITQYHLLVHHRTNLILKKNYLLLDGAEVVHMGFDLLLFNTICQSLFVITLFSGRTVCSLVVRRSLCGCICQS